MTEPAIDKATGKPVNVESGKLGELVAAGQVAPAPEARVPVIVEDGTVKTIAASDLEQAIAVGWQLASAEDVQRQRDREAYESAGAQAQAAGEAALRGLTIGLSDAGLVELGVDREGLLKRKELNPTISTGLEVTGALGPLLATGGSSGALSLAGAGLRTAGALPRAVAQAGRVATGGLRSILGEGVAARGVAGAAGGALEGGLYGLGQAVSESALQDVPLTAERLAAHAGMGALMGGGAGGVLSTAAASFERQVLPELKKRLGIDSIEAAVDKAGLRQWAQGRGKAEFTKLRRDFGNDAPRVMGQTVREEGIAPLFAEGRSWDEVHSFTKHRLKGAGRRIGEDLRAIDAAQPKAAADASLRIAGRAKTEILDQLEKTGFASDRALSKQLRREVGWLWFDEQAIKAELQDAAEAQGKRLTGGALDRAAAKRAAEMRATYVPSFEKLHELRATIDDKAFPKGLGDPTDYQKSLQKLRGVIEDEITAAADKAADVMGGTSAANYTANKQRYKALLWLTKMAEGNAASELSNRTVGLTDTIAGTAITGPMLASVIAGDVSVLGGLVVSSAFGAGAMMLNKFLRQQGQGLAARTGEKILALARAGDRMARETDSAVKRFFGDLGDAGTFVAAELGTRAEENTLAERFERRALAFERFSSAPEQSFAKSLGDTDQTAPAIGQEVRAVTMRAAQFLHDKMPRRRERASEAQPHLRRQARQRVSDAEMAKWLRYAEAVDNPRAALRRIAEGRTTREAAEVLRVVYPKLHAQLVETVTAKLASSKERLPYGKLVQLSLLLDRPLHPSLEPGFIAMCQRVHASSRKPAEQGLTPGQRRAPDIARQEATASQQLEGSA